MTMIDSKSAKVRHFSHIRSVMICLRGSILIVIGPIAVTTNFHVTDDHLHTRIALDVQSQVEALRI